MNTMNVMNLREGNLETCEVQDGDWRSLGTVATLFAAGRCHGAEVDGARIGLFNVGGEIFAIDDICTHGHALLSEGEFDGHEIECPLHAGLFDVRSGKALCAPATRDARRYEVKVESDEVFVNVNRQEQDIRCRQ